MVAYAVYLVYRSERLKKVLEAGADTIKYQKLKFRNIYRKWRTSKWH